jgi:hypothetical protein
MTTRPPDGPTSTSFPEPGPGVVPVVHRATHRISLERVCGVTFGHCTVVVPWTRSVASAVRRDVGLILGLHGGPLFAMTDDPEPRAQRRFAKFCRVIGFHFHVMVRCTDGVERPVYIRRNQPCPMPASAASFLSEPP